jgi:hypothetical protein
MGRDTQKRGPTDQRLSYIAKNVWYYATGRYVHMHVILSLNNIRKTSEISTLNMCVCVCVCVYVCVWVCVCVRARACVFVWKGRLKSKSGM